MIPPGSGGLERQPENISKVTEDPSRGAEVFTCSRCNFQDLPRTLRLHQLLGCFTSLPHVFITKKSVQLSHKFAETPFLKTKQPCNILHEKLPTAVSSGVKCLASSNDACELCGFFAPLRSLRLHQLLGCCAVILDVHKFRSAHKKTDNLVDFKIITKIQSENPNQNEKHHQLGEFKEHNLEQPIEKPFRCNRCSFKCSHKSQLVRHSVIHTGEKPFSCDKCNYKCSLKSLLKTHNSIHTGEKPLNCKMCSYKCRIIGDLKRHILTHTGEKPFSCNLCSYVCCQRGKLKQHNLTHTREKPFNCTDCGYSCSLLGNLKRHTLKHTKVKP